ncbi:hypothetical protein ACFPRA_01305 [Sporosarcina soli]|uniref:Uncharacterized protein n=1 Tax=Sporosarcina soli TaxID=334736 RepID=A0ABW0TF86_9BACL
MNQPHSSFFYFKATNNAWDAERDFKARVGSVEEFEAYYHFYATELDELQRKHNFVTRFNATDELESHYNFFAQWLVHDKQYDFTGIIAPLEMEIEYEDEADMIATVRTVDLTKISQASRRTVNETVVNNLIELLSSNEKSACVETFTTSDTKQDTEIEIAKTINAEFDVAHHVALDVKETGITPINKDAVIGEIWNIEHEKSFELAIDNSFEIFMQKSLSVNLESVEILRKISCPIAEIGKLESAYVPTNKLAVVDLLFESNKVQDVQTEIEDTYAVDAAAIDAGIEKIHLADMLEEKIAELEKLCVGETRVVRNTYVEYSERATSKIARLSTLENGTSADSVIVKNTVVESHVVANTEVARYIDVEREAIADMSQEKITDVDESVGGVVEAVYDAEKENANLGISVAKHSIGIEGHHLSESNPALNAELETPTKMDSEIIHTVDLGAFADGKRFESVDAVMQQFVDSAKVQNMSTEIEDTYAVDAAAIDMDVEESHLANRLDKSIGIIEGFHNGKSHVVKNGEIEQQANGNVEVNSHADVERQIGIDIGKTILPANIERQLGVDRGTAIELAEISDLIRVDSETTVQSGISKLFNSDKSKITMDTDIEDVHKIDPAISFMGDIEISHHAKKRLTEIVADIEEFLNSQLDAGDLEAEIENSIHSDLIHQHMARIEYGIHAIKLQQYIADLDELLKGELPEKTERDKIIWLIMGRPSWIHQYWQRTTR